MIPIAPEGWAFILPPLGLTLLLAWLGWSAAALLAGAVSAFMIFFFRDPERTPPRIPGAILAPADGRVVDVHESVEDHFVGPAHRVSVFLSPFDVHINRAPIDGLVIAVDHRPGRFAPAYRPEASERNERTTVAIQGDSGRVVVRQIAGMVARRVVCRVGPGDKLEAGQRFGMIKFGSRTDLVMPASVRVGVRVGDRVRAGESVIGVLP